MWLWGPLAERSIHLNSIHRRRRRPEQIRARRSRAGSVSFSQACRHLLPQVSSRAEDLAREENRGRRKKLGERGQTPNSCTSQFGVCPRSPNFFLRPPFSSL